MGRIFLYNHGGSGNHGCEALVRTVSMLLGTEEKVRLLSESPQQDIHYDIQKVADIEPAVTAYSKLSIDFLKAYLCAIPAQPCGCAFFIRARERNNNSSQV